MKVEAVLGGEPLDRGWAGWRALEAACDAGALTPFQRLAWARAWLATVGRDCDPWLLTWGSPCAAILPLVRVRRRGLRLVRLLGHGASDYLGSLPLEAPVEAFAAFGARLRDTAREFDLLDLQSLYADETRRRALTAALGRPFAERVYERCPVIDTTGTWSDYLASRRKKFRANLKRAERRIAAHGTVEIARERPTPELFEEMLAVERDSWKWGAGSAFLRDTRQRRLLYAAMVEDRLPCELWTLRVNRTLGGFAVVFVEGDVRYYYLPSFRARLSDAGSQLLAAVVRDTFDGAFREFDFLRGDEAYKLAWSHRERDVHQIAAAGGTLLGPFALAAVRARWRLARSPRLHALRARFRRMARTSG